MVSGYQLPHRSRQRFCKIVSGTRRLWPACCGWPGFVIIYDLSACLTVFNNAFTLATTSDGYESCIFGIWRRAVVVPADLSIWLWNGHLWYEWENANTGMDRWISQVVTSFLSNWQLVDRILHRGNQLNLNVYSRAELRGSDHKPGVQRARFHSSLVLILMQYLQSTTLRCESLTA